MSVTWPLNIAKWQVESPGPIGWSPEEKHKKLFFISKTYTVVTKGNKCQMHIKWIILIFHILN